MTLPVPPGCPMTPEAAGAGEGLVPPGIPKPPGCATPPEGETPPGRVAGLGWLCETRLAPSGEAVLGTVPDGLRPWLGAIDVLEFIPDLTGRFPVVRFTVGRFGEPGCQKVCSRVFPMTSTPTTAMIAFK